MQDCIIHSSFLCNNSTLVYASQLGSGDHPDVEERVFSTCFANNSHMFEEQNAYRVRGADAGKWRLPKCENRFFLSSNRMHDLQTFMSWEASELGLKHITRSLITRLNRWDPQLPTAQAILPLIIITSRTPCWMFFTIPKMSLDAYVQKNSLFCCKLNFEMCA